MNDAIRLMAQRAEQRIAPRFCEIDEVAQKNTEKVMEAFREFRVSRFVVCGDNRLRIR